MNFKSLITFSVPEGRPDVDIAVLPVDTTSVLEHYDLRQIALQIPRQFCFDSILEAARAQGEDLAQIPLRAVGFPDAAPESKVDVNAMRIVSQPMEVVFKYAGPSPLEGRHVGSILISALSELSGMSGSPVFLRVGGDTSATKRYVFAGMLVRAGKTSEQNIEFVSGERLANALYQASIV